MTIIIIINKNNNNKNNNNNTNNTTTTTTTTNNSSNTRKVSPDNSEKIVMESYGPVNFSRISPLYPIQIYHKTPRNFVSDDLLDRLIDLVRQNAAMFYPLKKDRKNDIQITNIWNDIADIQQMGSSQQGNLRLSGPPTGQGPCGGARRIPADIRADSLATAPPTPLE
ncbi:hypothetical protein PoB_002701100 [Plakobranchus ocellatus]|uniref:Uncharacterized protein n=1 Tax=Plakobranchus ocellatus TaxID=259542 RepID=A0AAV3ZN47_9GAST|nr:hypothetical protein PoB_002701100 [Plakobranchus ocellatus]